jgi:tRNA nucleotidyltransferase/poly(A) polymerase
MLRPPINRWRAKMAGEHPEPESARDALAAILARPSVHQVLRILNDSGEVARLVGGVVRNALLGQPACDIDIATTALPETVLARAKAIGIHAIPTGLAHGTVTLVVDGTAHEITTLREDIATNGRHASVRFGRSFRADAFRRDFTINALSADIDGKIYDYAGGINDLRARRVRFIGDADQRIREDLLRVFRFFRFSAIYAQGRLDPEGLRAAAKSASQLGRLSRERIRTEIMKLLTAPYVLPVVQAMATAKVLDEALLIPYDVDAFGALCRVEQAHGVPASPLRALMALAVRSDADIPPLRDALRLTNREVAHLESVTVAAADVAALGFSPSRDESTDDMRRLLYRVGSAVYHDALFLRAAQTAENMVAALTLADTWKPPRFQLTGKDAIALGIAKGPDVSRVLAEAENIWLANGMPDSAAAQHDILRQVVSAS